jgi:hypothetical protein
MPGRSDGAVTAIVPPENLHDLDEIGSTLVDASRLHRDIHWQATGLVVGGGLPTNQAPQL